MIDIHLNVRDVGGGNDLIEWDPANPGLVGSYRLKVDGKFKSSSYDGLKSSWRVKRTSAKPQYELWVFGPQIGLGVYPQETPPPPPPPPPGGFTIAPPVGPFTNLRGPGESGVFSRDPGSPDIGKLDVAGFSGYGVAQMASNNGRVKSTGTSHIHDIVISGKVGTGRTQNGTAEAGVWLGQKTLAERMVIKGGDWMGLWTGADFSGIVQDFEITDVPNIGAYLEHITRDATFRRFKIKSPSTGIIVEWTYGGEGSHDILFEDGEIYCPAGGYPVFGCMLDAGTYGCTFRRIRFYGPGNALHLPHKLADPTRPNVVEPSCVFDNAGSKVTYHDNNIG